MGILSIMHKLHDPFNSYRPSDPNRNSPSLLLPYMIAVRCFLTPTEVNESAVIDLQQQKLSFPSP